MKRKRHHPEQIAKKLRDDYAMLARPRRSARSAKPWKSASRRSTVGGISAVA